MRRKFKGISSEVDHKIFNFFLLLDHDTKQSFCTSYNNTLSLAMPQYLTCPPQPKLIQPSISLRKHLTKCAYLWVHLVCFSLCCTPILWAIIFIFAATFWKICSIVVVAGSVSPTAIKLQEKERQWNPVNTIIIRPCKSSLCHKRNLTLISNDHETAPISLFWAPNGINKLLDVHFKLPFNLWIGNQTMALFTG